MAKLRWGERAGEVAEVRDCADLEKRLRQLIPGSEAEPLIVTIEDVWGHELSLAIAGDEANLTVFTGPDRDQVRTEYFTIGDPARPGYASFMLLGGHHTEIPNSLLIATDAALAAVREFFETGRRSSAVSWDLNTF